MAYTALQDWSPLAAWLTSPSTPGQRARELLGGLVPEDPRNPTELLVLALLAVTADGDRLTAELHSRAHLTTTPISVDAMVDYQRDLAESVLGTTGPLWPLEAAITEHAPDSWRRDLYNRVHSDQVWGPAAPSRIAVAWETSVRVGHLAQSIASALDLVETTFSRSLLHLDSTAELRPNAVACVAQPWAVGRRQRADLVRNCSHGLVQITADPASVIAVAHPDLDRALTRHPSEFFGESGHPVVTAYPPLGLAAPVALANTALGPAHWEHARL